MKGNARKSVLTLLAVLALTLMSIGVWLVSGNLTVAEAAKSTAPLPQKPDNSQCLACHSTPGQVMTFPNGDTVATTIDPQAFDMSTHSNLDCKVCHTNITGFPHPKNTATTPKEFTLQYKDTCRQCHPNQATDVEGSAHYQLAKQGNPNTPVCSDCHNTHTQPAIAKDANGDPASSERAHIAEICSQCHSTIVDQYKKSVHGSALINDANPDVPACNDCHGVHKIKQARTVEFRLDSPQLCATCHTRHDIMDKYKISTNVLSTYVADFHGTTVTLFERQSPDQETNKPVCYDCHGVHNIVAVDNPQQGLAIKENMLKACQRCHPDASQNFNASWMSHYNASPTRFPLVYYVNLFYKIFIPLVLGGMGVFVLSDILFRLGIIGRKNRATEKAMKE
jgi:hypothetical protein